MKGMEGVEAEMKDVIVIPLRHHALFSYLNPI